MQSNFDIVNKTCFPEKYSGADGAFWMWLENLTGIGTGRRKACKESGLTGAEKRECARQLKERGWKKGDPIPDDMSGIAPEDIPSGYVPPSQSTDAPLPTKSYVPPYTANTYSPTTSSTDRGIETDYPQPPDYPRPESEAHGVSRGVWGSMSQGEKIGIASGAASVVLIGILIIGRLKKRKTIIV